MNEQEFQLELERFKQKERWEIRLFYFVLSVLWGRVLLFLDKGDVSNGVFLYWVLGLGLFLMIGEWLIQGGWKIIGYLNVQKEILRKKILGKNIKIWNDDKLRDLVISERKLGNKLFKKNKNEKKIEELKNKIAELKKEIWGNK